jgi:ribosomal protein S6E (S10)
MSKSPKAPPPPDYASAAKETAAGNLDAARQATAANRVNQITPYGNLTYSQAPRTFDQAGYDSAMSAYNNAPKPSGLFGILAGNSLNKMPNKESFYSGKDDGWAATTTLSPAQQQLLDQQNKTSLGLSHLADKGLGYVSDQLDKPFDMSGLPEMPTADYCGFPMRWDVQGVQRKRILAISGVGLKKTANGIKHRKTVCGNTIHPKISQVNLKVVKEGSTPLAPPKVEGEKKEEAKK